MREWLIHTSGGVAFVGFLVGLASIEATPVAGLIMAAVCGGYFTIYAKQNGGI